MTALAPDELVCDMAETYHVLDWRALGLPLAATLAGGLRETSRTCMALNHAPITTDTLLLGAMADSLRCWCGARPKTPSMAATALPQCWIPCWARPAAAR